MNQPFETVKWEIFASFLNLPFQFFDLIILFNSYDSVSKSTYQTNKPCTCNCLELGGGGTSICKVIGDVLPKWVGFYQEFPRHGSHSLKKSINMGSIIFTKNPKNGSIFLSEIFRNLLQNFEKCICILGKITRYRYLFSENLLQEMDSGPKAHPSRPHPTESSSPPHCLKHSTCRGGSRDM